MVTNIIAPNGQVLDENTVSTFNGVYTQIPDDGNDPGLIYSLIPGERYIYEFPFQDPGIYTVNFNAGAGLSDDIAVITQASWSSSVNTALFATVPVLALGNLSVLSAAVFQDGSPVPGATIEATIIKPDGSLMNLLLLDDGGDADNAASDGLYSGEFEPVLPGIYDVIAEINGTSNAGIPFTRQSTSQFEVVTPAGSLIDGVTDQVVDDNGNGLYDRLVLSVEVDIVEAGEHLFSATIQTIGGQFLTRNALVTLPVGNSFVDVDFESDAIQELFENGPYEISIIELEFVGPNGLQPSDILLDIGSTQAYQLSQFERDAILLTGNNQDNAQDLNSNGLFDRLAVSVEVDLINSGFYQWSGRLVDETGNEIDISASDGSLSAGVNTIDFIFNGNLIGQNATDGPYRLTDLLIFGGGQSLLATDVAETEPYLFEDFEGAPERCPSSLKITEFDSDQPSDPDTEEFIRIVNTGSELASVSGCVLVLFDGFTEQAYYSLDLNGPVESGESYLVGNFAVGNVDQIIPDNTIQNGPDAIALYKDEVANFPIGSPLIFDNLVSAVVYINDDIIVGSSKRGTSPAEILLSLSEAANIEVDNTEMPEQYVLEQNYPNPFNPNTSIRFSIPENVPVRLTVYDAMGREVERLLDQVLAPGSYNVQWNGEFVSSGIYFYRIEAGEYVQNRRMILLK